MKGGGVLGGNYARGMFKQLENALSRIDVLEDNVRRAKSETENEYLKIIYEKDAEISRLKAANAGWEERVAKLEAEVERLRKQLNSNSSNSSAPPSKDQKPNRPSAFNSREKSGRKSGGQVGHKGKSLGKAEIMDKIAGGEITHKVVHHGVPKGKYVSKYIIDIRTETLATEHRFYADGTGSINVPDKFRADVQYGCEIKTVAASLVGQGIVASNRAAEFIREISAGAVRISEGSIYNWLREFDGKAAGAIETIKTILLNSPIMHVDETGTRCEKKNMFFRNYSTGQHVLYTFNPTKGKKAIKDDGVLPIYIGTLIHDHNTVNYNYGTDNAECNVHIIRYLRASHECTGNLWALDMVEFLTGLNRSKKIAQAFGLGGFDAADTGLHKNRYDEIIAAGFAANKNTRSRIYGKDEKTLLNRLRKYKDNHLLFAARFEVPFDNNESERDLRIVKTKTKVSGCFRSIEGGKRYAALMSVVKTAIKQNLSPYLAVRDIFASSSIAPG